LWLSTTIGDPLNDAETYTRQGTGAPASKNAVRLILDNFGIIGFLFFGRIPVDSSHFSLHFDSILSPKAQKYSVILNVLIN
jgi:hypothetical protein